ncbi:MAG TPA: hypothetical protein VF598_10875, partial [Hymenobacter sp.]
MLWPMMLSKFLQRKLFLVLNLLSLGAFGQSGLIKVQQNTFGFAPSDTAILNPILTDITAAQVVFVGELDHGDGSSHPIKVQLIKQIQKESSLAIAYEADFFALNHRAQSRTVEERLRSLYPVWTECKQFAQVMQYILEQKIQVYGTDPQLITSYSKQNLVPYLDSILPAHSQKTFFLEELKELQEKQYSVQANQQRKDQFLSTLHAYQALVKDGFDTQLLYSVEAFALYCWQGLTPKNKV